MLERNQLDNINWIYYSFEIDRVSKEFKVAAFFMAYDFNVYSVSYKGKTYPMSENYLTGTLLHDNGDGSTEVVPISPEHEEMLKIIYQNRIVPLFGRFDKYGRKIESGKIDFIEELENPTGMNKYIINYAKEHGKFIEAPYQTVNDRGEKVNKSRIIGYSENNPDLFTIIIVDHIRKLKNERGFTLKQNIDKWLEYSTYLRNMCQFTFVNICHSGRQLSNVDRLKYAGEYIFPTADDVKDTGNLAEESTILLTLFNPNDEKYNIDKHFGVELANYPNYRSIHVADARNVECPQHIQTRMLGNINMFLPLENID